MHHSTFGSLQNAQLQSWAQYEIRRFTRLYSFQFTIAILFRSLIVSTPPQVFSLLILSGEKKCVFVSKLCYDIIHVFSRHPKGAVSLGLWPSRAPVGGASSFPSLFSPFLVSIVSGWRTRTRTHLKSKPTMLPTSPGRAGNKIFTS